MSFRGLAVPKWEHFVGFNPVWTEIPNTRHWNDVLMFVIPAHNLRFFSAAPCWRIGLESNTPESFGKILNAVSLTIVSTCDFILEVLTVAGLVGGIWTTEKRPRMLMHGFDVCQPCNVVVTGSWLQILLIVTCLVLAYAYVVIFGNNLNKSKFYSGRN